MNPSRLRFLSPLLLLGIPALAMIWTDQVNWSVLDFCIMGTLLFALSVTIRIIRRSIPNRKKKGLYSTCNYTVYAALGRVGCRYIW
ncbi:MAG: hypothetical protein P8H45_03900 [Flavobacteriaceae bacterium]|nr:hypothetical protein [Flavobacteriaceae bacterium]